MDDKKYTKKRKIIGLIILILVLLALGALTWVITQRLIEIGGSAGDMQEFIASFGYAGWLVALGFQVLQILVAFIPGEMCIRDRIRATARQNRRIQMNDRGIISREETQGSATQKN